MLIAPLHQDHDRREQIAAGVGQPVLVTVRVTRVGHFFQQSLVDQGAPDVPTTWGVGSVGCAPAGRIGELRRTPRAGSTGSIARHDLQGAGNGLAIEAM